MKSNMKYLFVLSIIVLFLYSCNKENQIEYLSDHTSFLSFTEAKSLKNKLDVINKTDKYKLYISIIHSNDRKESKKHLEYTFHNIPDDNRANAILIYLAIADQTINIKTGSSVQHYLTDSSTKYVIKNAIQHFSKGNYYIGLAEGINDIDSIVTNKRHVVF